MRKYADKILLGVAIVDAIGTITQWFTRASSLGVSRETWLGIGVGIFFAVVLGLLGLMIFGKKVKPTTPKAESALVDTTTIRFHLYGDERVPTLISQNNVWRWYYLRYLIMGAKKKGAPPERVGTITLLFLSFDKPVKVTTLEVSSPDINLPTYEVKEFNNRFAIIIFSDGLPMGTLEVAVRK